MASEQCAYVLTRVVGFTVYMVSEVKSYPIEIVERCPGHAQHCATLLVCGPGSTSTLPHDFPANFSEEWPSPSYEYRCMDNTGMVIFRTFFICSGQVGSSAREDKNCDW